MTDSACEGIKSGRETLVGISDQQYAPSRPFMVRTVARKEVMIAFNPDSVMPFDFNVRLQWRRCRLAGQAGNPQIA
jgi:hypothetical protein